MQNNEEYDSQTKRRMAANKKDKEGIQQEDNWLQKLKERGSKRGAKRGKNEEQKEAKKNSKKRAKNKSER